MSVYFSGIPRLLPVLLHIFPPYTIHTCFYCTRRNEKRTLDESGCVTLLGLFIRLSGARFSDQTWYDTPSTLNCGQRLDNLHGTEIRMCPLVSWSLQWQSANTLNRSHTSCSRRTCVCSCVSFLGLMIFFIRIDYSLSQLAYELPSKIRHWR